MFVGVACVRCGLWAGLAEAVGLEETQVDGWSEWRKISREMCCFQTLLA